MAEATDTIKLIVEYGFVTVFLAAVIVLLFRYFNSQIACKNAYIGKGDLKEHTFFQKIDFALEYKIPHLELGCKVRSMLFRDMLSAQFEAWKIITLIMLEKDGIFRNDAELLRANTLAISSVVKTYEKKWRELGVPRIASQHYSKWHNERVKYIMENVKDIVNSTYYDTEKEKMAAILCAYSFMVDITIVDAERTLRFLNGELTGKTYKGLKITK